MGEALLNITLPVPVLVPVIVPVTAAVLRNTAALPNPRHGCKGYLPSDLFTLASWMQTCANGSEVWGPQPLSFATRPHAFCLERCFCR